MHIFIPVEIEAPLERVWELIDDEHNLPKWMPDVVETTFPDGKRAGNPVGTRFRQKIKEGARVNEYQGLVTAYLPKELLGIRLTDERSFSVDVTYALKAEGGGTRLDYACTLRAKSLLTRLLAVLARPMTLRIVTRHMAALKRLAEGKEGP